VEAVFDVEASVALSATQKRLVLAKAGERISAVAQDARGQARNRRLALERLEAKLAKALRQPKKRRTTRPSKGSTERRLEQKRRTAERKRDRRPPADD
jgi:ribosome-associated protein